MAVLFFFCQAEDGIRDGHVTGVQTCALPIFIQDETLKQVYRSLDRCTVDQKSVIILRFIQSFSIKETADILNFSVSKVKTTQHRALKTMKKHLEHDGQKEARKNETQK